MPISIDATVGGASSNSFVTLSEAQSYMDARLNESAWESATTDSKNRALVEATRELSAREWRGRRVTTSQALSWPRNWVVNPDDPNGSYYASTVVPQKVKDATSELALQFIKAGATDVAARDSALGIRSESVGPISVEYETALQVQGLTRYPSVMRYLRGLLETNGGTVPMVRG